MIEANISPIDVFTIGHFVAGAFAGQWFTPTQVGIGFLVFEIIERPLKKNWPGLFPEPSQDSLANSAVDVIAAWLGAMAIQRVTRKGA